MAVLRRRGSRDDGARRATRPQPLKATLFVLAVAIVAIGFAAPSSGVGTVLFSAIGGVVSFALGIWSGLGNGFLALGSLTSVVPTPLLGVPLLVALAVGAAVGLAQALIWRATRRRAADPAVSAAIAPGIWGKPLVSGIATLAVNVAAAYLAAMLLSSLGALTATAGTAGLDALTAVTHVVAGGSGGGHDNLAGWAFEIALFLGGLLAFGFVTGAAAGAATGAALGWLVSMAPILAAQGAAEGGVSAALGPQRRARGLVAVGAGAVRGAIEGTVAGALAAMVFGLAPVFGLHLAD